MPLLLSLAFSALLLGHQQGSELSAIVSRIDRPLSGDSEKLTTYGDQAFEMILPIVERRLRIYDEAPKTTKESEEQRLRNAVGSLCLCAKPARTQLMTSLYVRTHEGSRSDLLHWLAEVGEPKQSQSLFEYLLRKYAHESYESDSDVPVVGLLRIGDSRDIAEMAKILTDETAGDSIRRSILERIASSGSPVALAAIDRVRSGSRRLPPLAKRKSLQANRNDSPEIKGTTINAAGTAWAIAEWNGLGNSEDLWLLKKQGDNWADPVFTGVSAYWPRHQTGMPAEGFEGHDKEMKQLIEGKEWIGRFVGNQQLTRDSDGDGYTDVVERWLGLNSSLADEDGDGLPDGFDKNPLVAPRTLSDTDKALKAAFDTIFCCRHDVSYNVFVTFPPSVKPFELESWKGLVLPLGLQPTRPDALFGIRARLGFQNGTPVRFGKDGLSADVEIEESGGYYQYVNVVQLRKFGQSWYPIAIRNVSTAVA